MVTHDRYFTSQAELRSSGGSPAFSAEQFLEQSRLRDRDSNPNFPVQSRASYR